MLIIPFSPQALTKALRIIQSGGVIAHATETCYGLACDLRNIDAVEKLFAIKQRPLNQPVSALFSSIEDAKQYVLWNEKAEALARQHLPGPLTLILPMDPDAPSTLFPIVDDENKQTSKRTTIGIRVSSHPHAQSLITAAGFPLSTTSANLHGKPNPYSPQDIQTQFANQSMQPDLILDSGILAQNPPSTVIDCTGQELKEKRAGDLKI